MREVELKVLNIDVKEVTKKLLSLGAKKENTVILTDTFFFFFFKKFQKANETFRLRTGGGKVFVTHKGKKTQQEYFKSAEETEVLVDHAIHMKKMLSLLGLQKIFSYEKKRTSFFLYDIKIEIDQYKGIPAYLELEGERRKIKDILEKLGFAMKDTTNKTASQILELYGKGIKIETF